MSKNPELSPDQTVAAQIVTLFRAQDLIDAKLLDGLAERLAAGQLTEEDWKLYAERTEDTVRENTLSHGH